MLRRWHWCRFDGGLRDMLRITLWQDKRHTRGSRCVAVMFIVAYAHVVTTLFYAMPCYSLLDYAARRHTLPPLGYHRH